MNLTVSSQARGYQPLALPDVERRNLAEQREAACELAVTLREATLTPL